MAVDEAALDQFLQDHDPSASAGNVNPPAEIAAPEAAAPETPETPETPAPEAPASEPDTAQDVFDRQYVEKLRRESAGYRERSKKFQEAFDGYEEEQVAAWLDLARQLKEDPRATAAELKALADQINSAYESDLETNERQLDRNEEYLSRADVEKILAEREQKADMERRVRQIETDAIELGYKIGSDDYDELLYTASKLPTGDIREAHAKLEARNQAIYDRMIAKVAGNPNPRVPQGTTPAQGAPQKLRTFEEANEALEAWLASQG